MSLKYKLGITKPFHCNYLPGQEERLSSPLYCMSSMPVTSSISEELYPLKKSKTLIKTQSAIYGSDKWTDKTQLLPTIRAVY